MTIPRGAIWLPLLLTGLANPVSALAAATQDVRLLTTRNDIQDITSLRRGAQLFVNKCTACHSAKYIRYSVIADYLRWSKKEVEELLIQGRAKILDPMVGGLPADTAKSSFGVIPPDLTLSAKVRGTDWLYTYLQAYYQDESGKIDNYLFPGVAMPNAFAAEQGSYVPVYGDDGKSVIGNKPAQAFFASPEEKNKFIRKQASFQEDVRDLVNFMEFISDPQSLDRYAIGKWVIAFLLLMLLLSILLKREYWRDVRAE